MITKCLDTGTTGVIYTLLYALTFYSLSPTDEELLDITQQDMAIIRQVRNAVALEYLGEEDKGH
jgi:hypothetical protein